MKIFAGKPLSWWAIQAAFNATGIDRVVLAIDRPLLSQVTNLIDSEKHENASKVEIYLRSDVSSQDGAYTEDVVLEWIVNEYNHPGSNSDRFFLIQATNPFTTSNHLDEALSKFERAHCGSIVSCAPLNRFLWRRKNEFHAEPVNYNRYERRRSQVWSDNTYYVENGAFYLSSIESIWRAKNRMGGNVSPYPMEWYTMFEIDDQTDFEIAQLIFKRFQYGQ